MTSDGIVVNGMTYKINSQTVIVKENDGKVNKDMLEIGQTVEVKAYVTDEQNIAKIIKIKDEDVYENIIVGEITDIGDSSITVNETLFIIDPSTQFYNQDDKEVTFDYFEVGMRVKIKSHTIDTVNL